MATQRAFDAAGFRERPWQASFAFVAGGLVSVVPMALIIEAIEGGRTDPTGMDGDLYGTIPLALLAGVAAYRLRHRVLPASFMFGAFLLQATFTVTFSNIEGAEWLVVLLLPVFWATLLVDLPAPARLALALPVSLVFMLAAGLISEISTQLAAVSGIVAALLGAVYFVGWGLRERVPWARHTAWSVAAAWSALAFLVALSDLFEFMDGIAIAGAVVTLALLCAIGFAWVLSQRRFARSPMAA